MSVASKPSASKQVYTFTHAKQGEGFFVFFCQSLARFLIYSSQCFTNFYTSKLLQYQQTTVGNCTFILIVLNRFHILLFLHLHSCHMYLRGVGAAIPPISSFYHLIINPCSSSSSWSSSSWPLNFKMG